MTSAKIDLPIYAIDFEGSKATGILEFAIIEIKNWQISSCETHLCKPKSKINKKILSLCHLNEDILKDKVPFEAHINSFLKARRKGLFLAHNKATEDSLLRSYFPNPEIFENFATNSKCTTWAPWIDTYLLCKKIFPTLQSYKLSDLIQSLNLNQELDSLSKIHCPPNRSKWHCAPYDTLASALILTKIASLKGFESLNIPWLCSISGLENTLDAPLF